MQDEIVWLTQASLAELFQVKPQNITMHLKNIYAEGELAEEATCKEFLQVQNQLLTMTGRELLTHAGTVSHEAAMAKAHDEYEKFRLRQLEVPTEVERHFVEAEEELKRIEKVRGGKDE